MIAGPHSDAGGRSSFVLVLCLERFWPAHGGVERYALEIARCLRGVYPVVVITAVRRDETLREALLARPKSFLEPAVGPAEVKVFSAGLGQFRRTWFRGMTLVESFTHQIAKNRYYQTRWRAMQKTAHVLAQDLSRIIDIPVNQKVVLHAMGPWEMSHVGDLLFPNAVRVVTPFIHPGHWGEDEWSRRWFSSRDGVVALGEEDANTCAKNGIPRDRMTVVPLLSPSLREDVISRRERRTVVFLGVARAYKGIDIFLDTVKLLRAEGADLNFVWAGHIPKESAHLTQIARAAGVQVKGAVSDGEKERILSRALCFCLPSATEITPYSILEAWAVGTPVVTTDDVYLREFVSLGGLLAPRRPAAFAAAIRRLAEKPELGERCAIMGRSYLLSRHDPSRVIGQLVSAYRDAIRQRGRACIFASACSPGRPPSGN